MMSSRQIIGISASVYILGHTPGGFEVDINTRKIISMQQHSDGEKKAKNQHLTHTVKCVIHTEDGKFISLIETCKEIHRLIDKAEKR